MSATGRAFDPACCDCPRLAAHLSEIRSEHRGYHAAPVAPFGDAGAPLLIVGLAPGREGANRTGRPFTGDQAGVLLFRTLHTLGLSSAAVSASADDGLRLAGCRITNAVKCLPPANRPEASEIHACNVYLRRELADLPAGGAVLALGSVAHAAVLEALAVPRSRCRFGHGLVHALPGGIRLVDSYHCSRYNVQTGRLTPRMFAEVVGAARSLVQALY